MKTIKILAIILIAAIIGALTWALFLPNTIHIEEKIIINAPIEKIFNQVNNFHNWSNWSLWSDSTMHTKYEGSQEGIGAKMLWYDEKEGKSTHTIIESIDNKKVVTELSFAKQDNKAKNIFLFNKTSKGVEVSWIMDVNDLNYPFGRFVGYMIKKGATFNFNKGLNNMKNYAESTKDKPDYAGYTIKDDTIATKYFICYEDSSIMDEMKTKMGNAFEKIMIKIESLQLRPNGSPVTEWYSYNPQGVSAFRCMIPVSEEQNIEGEVSSYSIPEGRFIWVKYIGSYEKSAVAWKSLDAYVKYNKLEMNGSPFEEYITDPKTEADTNKWITNIYFPVK